jgi:hypothetical protein
MEDARMSDEPLYAYVGRQAIFDRQLGVVAYELLYRNSEENRAEFSDANEATAATILNAFVELGLEDLVGELPIYVNLPSDFLLGRYPIPLPPDRTFIEVLEDVPVTAPVLEALRAFRRRGFRIALDDFVLTEETRPRSRAPPWSTRSCRTTTGAWPSTARSTPRRCGTSARRAGSPPSAATPRSRRST